MFKVELGKIARDKVTGFKGIVMGRAEYLTGCKKYALQSQKLTKEGKSMDWEWFDEMMVVEVPGKKFKKGTDGPGGPMRYLAPKA